MTNLKGHSFHFLLSPFFGVRVFLPMEHIPNDVVRVDPNAAKLVLKQAITLQNSNQVIVHFIPFTS